jgi:hypothetical protein
VKELITVRVVFDDGREVDIAHQVEAGDRPSPWEVLRSAAPGGEIPISDSAHVPLERVSAVSFVDKPAPEGPGWGPGLQDEDAASAAGGSYERSED